MLEHLLRHVVKKRKMSGGWREKQPSALKKQLDRFRTGERKQRQPKHA
jgi:hypothetical protein